MAESTKEPTKKGQGIVERSLVEDERILEEEKLVIDGIDISGRWNTFIEPRVDTDFERQFFKEFRSLPGGKYINRCWQCGNCTAVCTVTPIFPEFNPRHFIYCLQLGNMTELKKRADIAWRCVGCYKCTQRCPKDVNPAETMEALGIMIRKYFPEKVNPQQATINTLYHNQMLSTGRLNLAQLQVESLKKTGRFKELFTKSQLAPVLKMVLDGRIFSILAFGFFGFGKVSGWRRIRKVLKEQLEVYSQRVGVRE